MRPNLFRPNLYFRNPYDNLNPNDLHQLTAVSPLSDLIDEAVLTKHWQQYLILDAQLD